MEVKGYRLAPHGNYDGLMNVELGIESIEQPERLSLQHR